VLRTATVPAILAGYIAHRRCRQFGGGLCHGNRRISCVCNWHRTYEMAIERGVHRT